MVDFVRTYARVGFNHCTIKVRDFEFEQVNHRAHAGDGQSLKCWLMVTVRTE